MNELSAESGPDLLIGFKEQRTAVISPASMTEDVAGGSSTQSLLLPTGTFLEEPREHDVLGSRCKGGTRHPGNIFYRELVASCGYRRADYENTGNSKSHSGEVRRKAEKIVDIITLDRKGAFLKRKGDGWEVQSRDDAVQKVAQALRNNDYVVNPTQNRKPKYIKRIEKLECAKGGIPQQPPQLQQPQHQGLAPVRLPMSKTQYRAVAGKGRPIHRRALDLITEICNQRDAQDVMRILRQPKPFEKPQRRRLRLQYYHRYLSAMEAGMSFVEFSERLMAIWGGSIERLNLPVAAPNAPGQIYVQVDGSTKAPERNSVSGPLQPPAPVLVEAYSQLLNGQGTAEAQVHAVMNVGAGSVSTEQTGEDGVKILPGDCSAATSAVPKEKSG